MTMSFELFWPRTIFILPPKFLLLTIYRNRYAEAIQFCSAYVGARPGAGAVTSTVNTTLTSVILEATSATKTNYILATTMQVLTLQFSALLKCFLVPPRPCSAQQLPQDQHRRLSVESKRTPPKTISFPPTQPAFLKTASSFVCQS